ncbi:MAG: NDP-sugar synthase [Candidatus Thermoplasmatota archaeon]
MEAIILAGGFGTRLKPLTYTRAKSLLPVLNRPMISYIMEKLPSEIETVILAVNYRKDQIEDYFKTNDYGREIIVNDEPEPLGTGGATKYAEEHITGRFFVLNADIISSIDLSCMIKYHKKKKAVSTISLWPVKNVSEFGVVDILRDGKIRHFVEKPRPEDAPSNLINAGVYLLEPEVLDYIPRGRLVSMEKEIFPRIISDTGRFYGYRFKGYWIDVGRIQSYHDVHKLLMKRRKLSIVNGENCSILGEVEDSCLGDHVIVEEDSNVTDSIIFNNVHIGRGVKIKQCIIGEDCVIEDKADMENVIVGDNEHIRNNMILNNAVYWTQPIPSCYPDKQIGNVIGE